MTSVATQLEIQFPRLWALAQQYDFAERLGGSNDPLAREADAALRELWMARTNNLRPERDSNAPA